MTRILNGLKIYQEGAVELDHKDDGLVIFNVKGSKGETYQVSIYDNSALTVETALLSFIGQIRVLK